MAFRELDLSNKAINSSDLTGVTVGLSKIKGKNARLRLTLRNSVVATLQWVKSTRFKALVGTGEDLGILQFVPAGDGAGQMTERKLPRSGERVWSIALGHIPELPDIIAPAVPCLWEALDGNVFEVTLPAWAKRKPQAAVGSINPTGETELQRQNREAAERRKRMGMK